MGVRSGPDRAHGDSSRSRRPGRVPRGESRLSGDPLARELQRRHRSRLSFLFFFFFGLFGRRRAAEGINQLGALAYPPLSLEETRQMTIVPFPNQKPARVGSLP